MRLTLIRVTCTKCGKSCQTFVSENALDWPERWANGGHECVPVAVSEGASA